jgi:ribonucleotide monophosphatase NagD (HAD superfamily)
MGGGVAGAEESGIGVILVRAGKQGPGDLDRDVEPALVIESIAELPRRWHELHRPRKSGNL